MILNTDQFPGGKSNGLIGSTGSQGSSWSWCRGASGLVLTDSLSFVWQKCSETNGQSRSDFTGTRRQVGEGRSLSFWDLL